jgi:hypothetical protein
MSENFVKLLQVALDQTWSGHIKISKLRSNKSLIKSGYDFNDIERDLDLISAVGLFDKIEYKKMGSKCCYSSLTFRLNFRDLLVLSAQSSVCRRG